MNKIYTYTDLSSIEKCGWYDELKEYPQIAVSTDLRKGMNYRFKDFKYKVCDFKQLLDNILPEWTTEETKFQETVILSAFFREHLAFSHSNDEINWLKGCRKNIPSILASIIMLEEADTSPEDIVPSDKNLELFADSWKYLADRDPEILKFRKRMSELDSDTETEKILSGMFGITDEKKLVLHGFYYFTPVQKRILDIFERHGFELIYLFPYDKRYRTVNEIWTRTYSRENGYEPENSWMQSSGTSVNTFGALMEGTRTDITNEIKIIEYKSVYEFSKDMKRAKDEKFAIYSSSSKNANKILKDYFPEEYGERRLLSYPVGQFVYTLCKIWDEDSQTVILDSDSLIRCFSSGWLSVDGVSGRDYLNDLEYILPFFDKCRKIDEWNERLDLLDSIYSDVIDRFAGKLSIHSDADKRWQEVLGNPFNSFSVFAVSKDRLNVVIGLISRLIEMVSRLFDSKIEVVVGEHIRKLDRMLRENSNADDIYAEEKEIAEELLGKFEKIKSSGITCFPSDISSAVNLLLEEAYDNEENRKNNFVGMVYPLYQIDASVIKNSGKVHICLCDIDNMPGNEKEYTWPLTEEVIDDIICRTGNMNLRIIKQIMEDSPVADRYFMYSAIKNPFVELSWVSCINGKKLAPSPYIRLMRELGNAGIKSSKNSEMSESYVNNIMESATDVSGYNFYSNKKFTAKEAKMDYVLCPLRYLYGYVLQKFPSYQTVFLQNYAVNGLITAVYNLVKDSGVNMSEIQENILELFPNLREAEKRQILDYLVIESGEHDTESGMTSDYADVAYTDERLKIKFPERKTRENAKEKYGELLTPDGKKNIDLYKRADAREACFFCQHADYCRNSEFMSDQEALYD